MKDADHGDEFIRQLQEDKEYSRSRARARVLFSDFQASRLVNADAYKSNASWWRRQIVLGAQRGILPGKDRCLIRGKDISRACVEGGLPEPLGLAAVLDDMIRDGELRRWDEEGWGGWIYSRVIQPTGWWIGGVDVETRDLRGLLSETLVLTDSLVTLEKAVIVEWRKEKHYPVVDALFDEEGFERLCQRASPGSRMISRKDALAILRGLEREGKAVVEREGEEVRLVKILGGEGETRAITEGDRGCVQVRRTLETLSKQITGLHTRMDELRGEAKAHVASGRKTQALSVLERRSRLGKLMEGKISGYDRVEEVWVRMREAGTDLEIVRAYEAGTRALKAIHAEGGLTVERVEGVKEELDEALAYGKEVEEAMAGAGAEPVDEAELEEELAELVKRDKEEDVAEVNDLAKALDALHVEGSLPEQASKVEEKEREKENVPMHA